MKIEYIEKEEMICLPLLGSSYWAKQKVDRDGLFILLNSKEHMAGGVFIPLSKIVDIIRRKDEKLYKEVERYLTKSEKSE